MMKYKRWIGAVLLLPLIMVYMDAGTANAQSSANYKLQKDVLDVAGGFSTSTNFNLEDAVSQPSAIGNSSSTDYLLSAGYTGAFDAAVQTQHFTFTANTGDSYSIVMTAATLDGAPLVVGDEIGVFTPGDLCVGASIWDGNTPLALVAWIDDSQTQGVVDGYAAGDSMFFRIWQQSNDEEFDGDPTYAVGNGTFGNGAFAQLALAATSGGTGSSVILVTNTKDSGEGSLRDAILKANTAPGPNEILFNIPQTDAGFNSNDGTWTIQPTSALPTISDSGLVIDGSSQADFIDSDTNPLGPEIVLNGQKAGELTHGISIFSSNNTIKQLIINGFQFNGIYINGHSKEVKRNRIIGNYIGTNAAGNDTIPNSTGIRISNSSENMIGGPDVSSGNLLSGNRWWGIAVDGDKSSSNLIIGNYVGTDVAGNIALGNGNVGIYLMQGTHNHTIGGTQTNERNIISGNVSEGIRIEGHHNRVLGNYIGTDVSGTIGLGNYDGISLMFGADNNTIGGTQPGEGNLVSSNRVRGIVVVSDFNQIAGNYVGTGATHTEVLGNKREGISIVFDANKNVIGPDNIIANNGVVGVSVQAESSLQNTITQNSIFHNLGVGIQNWNGGNTELSPPKITGPGGSAITGTAPANSTVEIFSDDDDEGRIYEGTVTADGAGNFSWSGTATGPNVTATATDPEGNTSEFSVAVNITSVETSPGVELPESFSLSQNYPNPFNPSTTITFSLPKQARVQLQIFDLTGREVASLMNEVKPAGRHTTIFNASEIPSGIYFYRLQTLEAGRKTFTQIRKLTLIK